MPYVITAQADDDSGLRYYRDGVWSGLLSHADLFKTAVEALSVLQEPEFTKKRVMSNGAVFPPSAIHGAANISNHRPTGSVALQIMEVILQPATNPMTFHASIDDRSKKLKLSRIQAILDEGGVTVDDLKTLQLGS